MWTRCQRCGREWDYKGKQDYFTNCPNCMVKVNVRRQRIAELKKQIEELEEEEE